MGSNFNFSRKISNAKNVTYSSYFYFVNVTYLSNFEFIPLSCNSTVLNKYNSKIDRVSAICKSKDAISLENIIWLYPSKVNNKKKSLGSLNKWKRGAENKGGWNCEGVLIENLSPASLPPCTPFPPFPPPTPTSRDRFSLNANAFEIAFSARCARVSKLEKERFFNSGSKSPDSTSKKRTPGKKENQGKNWQNQLLSFLSF